MKVEDLKVGSIIVKPPGKHCWDYTFARVNEVTSKTVRVDILKALYRQEAIHDAIVSKLTDEVEYSIEFPEQTVCSDFKLYDKYNRYCVKKWDLRVGDIISGPDKGQFTDRFHRPKYCHHTNYCRVKAELSDNEVILEKLKVKYKEQENIVLYGWGGQEIGRLFPGLNSWQSRTVVSEITDEADEASFSVVVDKAVIFRDYQRHI
ncbi:hypothetical protein OS493_016020 [Desmophyllum pertusum]|uniref:Uncharacterized protein n=2 Tax=Desmophyllum pertusum TaxID=174260 RepID=A0A9X0A293_9CNID|nr:hypothetical protein OS493_016020 [Desmophyllum pertusum]